jgi:hypothetical protein
MKLGFQPRKWLEKKSRVGFRGYPVGTIAFYGPDDRRASKVVVGIIPAKGAEATELRKWFSEAGDVRKDPAISEAIVAFLREHDVRSVAMTKGLLGCPHEEGPDYPEGEVCPLCPFWANRDRWTGKRLK